jgi:hypothetical protein
MHKVSVTSTPVTIDAWTGTEDSTRRPKLSKFSNVNVPATTLVAHDSQKGLNSVLSLNNIATRRLIEPHFPQLSPKLPAWYD